MTGGEPWPACVPYSASGLALSSTLRLPELCAVPEITSDPVTIRMGTVPVEFGGKSAKGPLFEVSPDRFFLRLNGVASYLVLNGSEIIIENSPNADDDSVRLFLLGPVLGALMHQRGLLPLHASAIETPKGAVLFAGKSGAGKSALAAMFLSRGYRIIADEICVINTESGEITVQPAFPRLLLWPDVIQEAGLWSASVRPARPSLKKYHVPVHDRFAAGVSSIRSIYVLRVTLTGEWRATRLGGVAKVSELMGITYRRQFAKGVNAAPRYLEQITRMARSIEMSRFSRPIMGNLLETADSIERDFAR